MTPSPCPYALTCLASRLPTDNICRDCTVVQRAPVEAVAGACEPDLLVAARKLLAAYDAWNKGSSIQWYQVEGAVEAIREIVKPHTVAAVATDGEVTP